MATSAPDDASALRVLVAGSGPLAVGLLKGLLALQNADSPTKITVVAVLPWSCLKLAGTKTSIAKLLTPLQQTFASSNTDDELLDFVTKAYLGPVLSQFSGLNDLALTPLLNTLQPHLVLTASWGERLSPELLERHPNTRFVNVHPSYLPNHRGPNPYLSVIRQGETQTGISFHHITQGWDEGPVIYQQAVSILPTDTGGSLRERCAQTAQESVAPFLACFINATEEAATPQNPALASYYNQSWCNQAKLDWSLPPQSLEQQVRASQPWFCCYTVLARRWPISVKRLSLFQVNALPQPLQTKALAGGLPGEVLAANPKQIWLYTSELGIIALLEGLVWHSPSGESWPQWFWGGFWAKLACCSLLKA